MEPITPEQDIITDNTAPDDININADDSAAGTNHLNEAVAEEDAMEKLQTELDEQKDKYLRLVAEFDNFRRRTAKEKLDLIQTGGKDVILAMLEVLDDAERAETQLQKSDDVAVIKEGISLVFAKLKTTLLAKGVKEIESIGKPFDVELHEAITDIPAATEAQKDTVIDQIQKGYYLNDKLIRFAKVVVGK